MTDKRPQLYAEQVEIGHELHALVKTPTAVQLFRYSAVTWNAHRIHTEPDYARKEGHPDVLVQAHLHGAFLAQLVMDWAGPKSRMLRFAWSNRGRAIPGDTLSCTGRVVDKTLSEDRHLVELELLETNQNGQTCAQGKATVALPLRGDGN